MEIRGDLVEGVNVVTARGRLDGTASAPFAEQVQAMIRAEKPKLLIDFSGIDYVTSAGLRAVLIILKRVKSLNGSFALCNVQKPVREVLDMSGFTGMIDVHGERAAALRAMALR